MPVKFALTIMMTLFFGGGLASDASAKSLFGLIDDYKYNKLVKEVTAHAATSSENASFMDAVRSALKDSSVQKVVNRGGTIRIDLPSGMQETELFVAKKRVTMSHDPGVGSGYFPGYGAKLKHRNEVLPFIEIGVKDTYKTPAQLKDAIVAKAKRSSRIRPKSRVRTRR